MSSAQAAKSYGLKTLKQGSDFYGIHDQTLSEWKTTRPELFKVACQYAAAALNGEVDYREMLIKYMALVANQNGVTFIHPTDENNRFTDQEWNILLNIANLTDDFVNVGSGS